MRTFRIRPRRAAQRPRLVCFPPGVEALEPRRLLATFTVTNNADSGPGSLRQAILDAIPAPGIPPDPNAIPDVIEFRITPVSQSSDLDNFPVGVGGSPVDIVTALDGNLYFADRSSSSPRIGRLTTAGVLTSVPLASGSIPISIAAGPDGILYFTDRNPSSPRIGRITTAGVELPSFPLPADSRPDQITIGPGPDFDLYFTDDAPFTAVRRLTRGGIRTDFRLSSLEPGGITTGPDGNLWFTDDGFIARLTPNGDFTSFLVGQDAGGIVSGPDGNLWFTNSGPIPRIGRITPSGVTQFFPLGAGDIPIDITAAPDGNLYFTVAGPNRRISQITPAGVIQDFLFPGGTDPMAIAPGPDGNLYFTQPDSGQVGRFNLALFNFGSATAIRLLRPLPTITEAVNISGYTQLGSRANVVQPGFSQLDIEETDVAILPVRLDGAAAGLGANGLTITGSNSTIAGLSITRFAGAGIAIEGVAAVGNTVEGNFIGIAAFDPFRFNEITPGTNPLANGLGVRISGSNNRIGGTTPGSRNVVQGNRDAGIEVRGPAGTGNLIETNFILDNGDVLRDAGGTPLRDANGDLIPATPDSAGIRITTSNNFIGEAVGVALAGGGNVISGNIRGVYIVGPTAQGNILLNNEIGTNVGIARLTPPIRGTLPRSNVLFEGNLLEGVLFLNATLNVVGGTTANSRNVIGVSGTDAVSIQGPGASGNRVLGNFIGFNFRNNLIAPLPNRDGVNITSANNAVGGTTQAARNFIVENRRNGVTITGPSATGNQIQGNFIGTFQGGEDVGNTFEGILIQDASDNLIGGTATGARNVISGNNNGVVIRGTRASGNRVLGNFIGTASDGATDLGNAVEGVLVDNSPRNTIGGVTPEARNIISGNNRGVRLTGVDAAGNLVQGNFIGTDVSGTQPVGNSLDGVLVTAGASGNSIGGADPVTGNTIAFNGGIGNVGAAGVGNGVLVESGTGNAILSNRIFSNNLLGIDLGGDGITPNDPRDGDGGPNNFQNAPVLTGATNTTAQGVLNSTPNTTFTIQFFGNVQSDPSGFGEGQTPLGTTTVTTDATGNAPIVVTLSAVLPSGQFVTATATSPGGDTSEFSNAVSNAPAILQFSAATYTVDEGAGTATITVTRTGNTGGRVTVGFAASDGTAVAGMDYLATSGTLTFNPGEVNLTFTVPIVQDTDIEPNETVTLILIGPGPAGSAILGPQSTSTLTIRDDDGITVQFRVADVSVGEGDGVATITVTRSNGIGTASVDFATSDGTATAGADYTSTFGRLTFGPGETARTITVSIVSDVVPESNETFFVTLSNATGSAVLGTPSRATITIVDDDQPGTIQFSQAIYVFSEGLPMAIITVTRTGGAGGTVTVRFATADGTATAGADYVATAGVLIFNPGVMVQTITVPLLNDPFVEPDETVNLVLDAPSGGATLGSPASATLTIVNDDVDRFGPIVTDVQTVAGRRGITGLRLVFNEALNPATAQDLFNYELVSEGRDGRFGTFDDASVALRAATYDPSTFRVTLTPARPLRTGRFYRVRINPTEIPVAGRNVTDVLGNLLDGNRDGLPGGRYVALIGRGTNLNYRDRDGDRVVLQLRRGGTLELRRAFHGEAEQLRIVNPTPGRSELTGHLRLSRTGSDGRTTVPVIVGGRGVRNRLRTPPFFLDRISEAAVEALLASGAPTA